LLATPVWPPVAGLTSRCRRGKGSLRIGLNGGSHDPPACPVVRGRQIPHAAAGQANSRKGICNGPSPSTKETPSKQLIRNAPDYCRRFILKKLDQDFKRLLDRLPIGRFERHCWKILRGAEGILLRLRRGKSEEPPQKPQWELDWEAGYFGDGYVSSAWFGDIEHDHVCHLRYAAFVETIRFVTWGYGPHGKRKQKDRLHEALRDYLDSRGKTIQEKGRRGRPSYSLKVLNYALRLRQRFPELKTRNIRTKCRTKFPDEHMPLTEDNFRRFMNRPRKNRAN